MVKVWVDRGFLIVLGILVGLMVADATTIEGTLRAWQTLVAGILAIMAAWWSVRAIHRQIAHAAATETTRYENRRAAARATLPLALSSISHYAEECCSKLVSLLDKCKDGLLPIAVPVPPFPPPPVEAISSLKEMTELASSTERMTLAALLGKTQIQWSRLNSVAKRRPETIVSDLNLESYIIDAAEIDARAAAIFAFARHKSEQLPAAEIGRQEVGRSIKTHGIFGELEDRLIERINRHYPDRPIDD